MPQNLSVPGGFAPLTTWPGALLLDPAGGSVPRPPYRLALRARRVPPRSNCYRRLCCSIYLYWCYWMPWLYRNVSNISTMLPWLCQACRGYPWIYPWIDPCVDNRLRLYCVYIYGYTSYTTTSFNLNCHITNVVIKLIAFPYNSA